jgi:ABC-type dipeptide/oligopeptide/nickel transport system ATPase component
LSVDLTVTYPKRAPVLEHARLQMRRGEVLGLVGQSGSGKSTLALSLLGLMSIKGGKAAGLAELQGRNLLALSERELRRVRGRDIGLVLQSPLSSLNPALKIGTQLGEGWRAHASGTREECKRAICDALSSVSLPCDEQFLKRYPSQVSVGQAQRVLIAMAILHRPALLIADEPTSALDAITQTEILELFASLNRDLGMTILYISHDLLSVASICHRIAILHGKQIVECGNTAQIFAAPLHEYTRSLVAAVPRLPEALLNPIGVV